MEKIVEQLNSLVKSLQDKIRDYDVKRKLVDEQADQLVLRKKVLNDYEMELVNRESKILPIENIEKTRQATEKVKAEADLELSKLRADRDKFEQEKKNSLTELVSEKQKIKEQIALYNRGAEENKELRIKLEKKLKALQEVRV